MNALFFPGATPALFFLSPGSDDIILRGGIEQDPCLTRTETQCQFIRSQSKVMDVPYWLLCNSCTSLLFPDLVGFCFKLALFYFSIEQEQGEKRRRQ